MSNNPSPNRRIRIQKFDCPDKQVIAWFHPSSKLVEIFGVNGNTPALRKINFTHIMIDPRQTTYQHQHELYGLLALTKDAPREEWVMVKGLPRNIFKSIINSPLVLSAQLDVCARPTLKPASNFRQRTRIAMETGSRKRLTCP